MGLFELADLALPLRHILSGLVMISKPFFKDGWLSQRNRLITLRFTSPRFPDPLLMWDILHWPVLYTREGGAY